MHLWVGEPTWQASEDSPLPQNGPVPRAGACGMWGPLWGPGASSAPPRAPCLPHLLRLPSEGEVKVLLMSASRSPRPARLLRGRGGSEGSRRAARPRGPAGATLPASPRSRAAAAASERWPGSAPSTAPVPCPSEPRELRPLGPQTPSRGGPRTLPGDTSSLAVGAPRCPGLPFPFRKGEGAGL